jgi:hypothetical protein
MKSKAAAQLPDYFQILGIGEGATPEEIKRAYKVQAKRYHPDRRPEGTPEQVNRRFQRIQEAYEVLSDPDRRKTHLDDLEAQRGPRPVLCAIPGCRRQAGGPCIACGKPACAFHLVPECQTGGRFAKPGFYCHACLPTCAECGALVVDPVPAELKAAEAVLRSRKRGGTWCPECLRDAPIYACSGCGTDGHREAELRTCKYCGKSGFCAQCMRTIDGVKDDPCAVCARVLIVRGVRVIITRVKGYTENACEWGWSLVLGLFGLYVVGAFVNCAIKDHQTFGMILGCSVLLAVILFGIGYYPSQIVARLGVIAFLIAEEILLALVNWAERLVRTIGYPRPTRTAP